MSLDNMVMVFSLGEMGDYSYAIIGDITHPMLENAKENADELMDLLAKSNMACVLCEYKDMKELHDTACLAYKYLSEKSEYGIEYGLRFTNWNAPALLQKLHDSANQARPTTIG